MTNELTPAPWHVDDGDDVICAGGLVAVCYGGHNYNRQDPEYSAAMRANARLIAASPTMYEYVKKQAEKGDVDAQEIISAIHE